MRGSGRDRGGNNPSSFHRESSLTVLLLIAALKSTGPSVSSSWFGPHHLSNADARQSKEIPCSFVDPTANSLRARPVLLQCSPQIENVQRVAPQATRCKQAAAKRCRV